MQIARSFARYIGTILRSSASLAYANTAVGRA